VELTEHTESNDKPIPLKGVDLDVRWRRIWWFHPMGSRVFDYLRLVLPACTWWVRTHLYNNADLLDLDQKKIPHAR
jgi:hypothetical protein